MLSDMKRGLRAATAMLCLLAGACTNPVATSGNYTQPIGGAPVLDNPTPYTKALYCLGAAIGTSDQRRTVSVGKLLDYTGKEDIDTGKRVTQGAALMAMSALGKAQVPQVERFDTSVTELELKFADNKLVGDKQDPQGFRRIVAGQIPGSDYHLIGGITELNYNIRSNEVEALFDVFSVGGKVFVMNVGIDLRLVETKSLKLVRTVSYQKQIIGRELKAGLFKFFDNKLLDIGAGERALEPIQLAVRSLIERAVFEMIRDVHNVPTTACSLNLETGDRVVNEVVGGKI